MRQLEAVALERQRAVGQQVEVDAALPEADCGRALAERGLERPQLLVQLGGAELRDQRGGGVEEARLVLRADRVRPVAALDRHEACARQAREARGGCVELAGRVV